MEPTEWTCWLENVVLRPEVLLLVRRAIYERETRNAINGHRYHRGNRTADHLGNRNAARRSRLDSPALDDRRFDADLAGGGPRRSRASHTQTVIHHDGHNYVARMTIQRIPHNIVTIVVG